MAHQVIYPLPIGSEAVGSFLRGLVWPRGLEIVTGDPLPLFPERLNVPLTLDFGDLKARQYVPKVDEALIPLVLTFDCVVRSMHGGKWKATERFEPYYLRSVLVLSDKVPDLTVWRRLNCVEAICCLAQYPQLGHVTYWSTNCADYICVAYFSGSRIVVECAHPRARQYNAAYTLWGNNSPHVKMRQA